MTGDLLMDSCDNDSISIGCTDFGDFALQYAWEMLITACY